VKPMACDLAYDRGGVSRGNDGWCIMAGLAQARLPSSERPMRGQMCALASACADGAGSVRRRATVDKAQAVMHEGACET